MAQNPKIYTHPTDYHVEFPNIDLLTLLFDSEHSVCTEESVLHHAADNPDNKITKADLRDLAQRVAHGLRENYGIGANGPNKDVVTVISYGQILVPAALFGVIAAGGVYSAASPSSTVAELHRTVDIGQSRLIICGEEHKDVAVKAAKEAGLPLKNILLLDSTANAWTFKSLDGSIDVLPPNGGRLAWEPITDADALRKSLIIILWSSGTTGLPKGVMISHQNFVAEVYIMNLSGRSWAAKEIEKGTFVPKPQSTLAHLPISHIAGLLGYLVGPMYAGATVIWMRKYIWNDLVKYLKTYKITSWYTVPSIWLRITKSPEITREDLSSLEAVSTGAAPMDGVLMKNVNAKVGSGTEKLIGQTWGLSETTGAVAAPLKDDPRGPDDTGCIGYILPSVELRVVDDNDKDVQDPDKEPGELLIRSPLVTQGYFRNEKATADAFIDGWFRSGDVGIRRDGKFYVVDRKKELLKYKGLQVAPAELENLLFTHPQIKEAAVVGLPAPDDPATDLPRAYIVANDRSKISEDEVKEFISSRLASYKQLRGGAVFVDEIPKNAIGKMLRRELRERAKKEVAQEGRSKL